MNHPDQIATAVVDAAFDVHSSLGVCFSRRALTLQRQLAAPVVFGGVRLDSGLRLDLPSLRCVFAALR